MTAGDAGRGEGTPVAWRDWPTAKRLRLGWAIGSLALLALLFVQLLTKLMVYAARSDLHSHILLVPLVSAYVLYERWAFLPLPGQRSITGTVVFGGIGLLALAAGLGWPNSMSMNDQLALTTLSFVSLVAAVGYLFLGSRWMAAAAFPVAFLAFMVPLPDAAVDVLERASALASAEAAALYFNLAGTPHVRQGTVFELPGIAIEVARECSGIRSSWVLLITSVLASHLFLKSSWRRLALVVVVVPLGILRNGFRVFVIGMLCVYVGPEMIESTIHRQGGPFFFALSLVPLLALLWWLKRQERPPGSGSGDS